MDESATGSITVSTSLPLDGRKVNEEGVIRVAIHDNHGDMIATAEVGLAEWVVITQGHRSHHPAVVHRGIDA